MSKKRKMNLGLDKSLSGLRSNCERVLLFEGGGQGIFFILGQKLGTVYRFLSSHGQKFFFSLFSSHKKIMSAVEVVFRFACPHCGTQTDVNKRDVNCAIFRCGVWKHPHPHAGQWINPHMPKKECEAVVDQVYGCTKPFRMVFRGDTPWVEPCDYI